MVEELKMDVCRKGRGGRLRVEDEVVVCVRYWGEEGSLFDVGRS